MQAAPRLDPHDRIGPGIEVHLGGQVTDRTIGEVPGHNHLRLAP